MNASAIKYDGTNKYIRITDIDEQSSRYLASDPVSPDGELNDKYLVKESDILFARTGASVGKSYLYNCSDGRLYFAGFLIRARIAKEYNAHFIFAQTQNQHYNRWVKLMSMRSGQPGLNSQEYASCKISLTSRKEQDKIASFLALLDRKIDTQSKIIERTESSIKSIVDRLLNRAARFKSDNGSQFPKWTKKKVGIVLKKFEKKATTNNQYPVLTSARTGIYFQKDYFDGNDVASKDTTGYNIVPRGYFTYRHMSDDTIFKFNINTICDYGIVSTLYPVFTTIGVNDIFLRTYLNECADFKNYALMQKQGGSRTYMYFNKLTQLELLFPSLSEQNRIADFIVWGEKKIEIENQILLNYKKQKKYLLDKMFI
ncbi:restriction endonuclease subunit S [Sediminibacterium roseum]|uniref:Restriction endonuclease subunit S n=2 Tax=Sediminibacterium roseum TaxID=1978412 RepID=A0ABW9ZW37_9BACT|nr:restriction endonuclease subunit S [Sediminibacterium roseum]